MIQSKGTFSWGNSAVLLDFVQNYLSPPSPRFGQVVLLFLNTKNVDLINIENHPKILLNKGRIFALWVMYGLRQWAWSKENTFFIGSLTPQNRPKIQFVKIWQQIWARPFPPLIWTKSKRTALFPQENVPKSPYDKSKRSTGKQKNISSVECRETLRSPGHIDRD